MEKMPRDKLTPSLVTAKKSSENLTVALEAMQASHRGNVLLDYLSVHKAILQPSHLYPLLKLLDRYPDRFVKFA
jgi:hypothetical protein